MKNLIATCAILLLLSTNSFSAQTRPENYDKKQSQKEVNSTLDNTKNFGNKIVAGRGWDKILLGTSKADIEKILGKSDLDSPYRSFHDNSGIYVSFSNDQAKEISFETTIGKYQHDMKATPDKKLKWGATMEQVIKVYGNSYKKRQKEENYGGEVLNSIIYSNVEFSFANNKLVRISVFTENERLKSFL